MDLNEFLIEFTNKGRLDIFKSLFHVSKRHSEIEKELTIPGPEISRNLKRLLKKELIFKTGENKYEITGIGKIFYHVLKILEISLKYKDFFNLHDISSLPISLILQLGTFEAVKINDKTMENVQLWSDLVKNSEKFIYAIFDQYNDSILPIVEKKIKNQSIEIKALAEEGILTESIKVGKKFKDRHAFYDKLNIFQNIQILNQPKISLIATDKGSILFLNKDGKIDYSQCLIDYHDSFIKWTVELFEWYWKEGKSIKPFIEKSK